MTKLGVQGGPEEEAKQQEVVKDPKVFTVVQPTFVPIPIQNTEPMRKSVPSTWCLMARLLALVLVGSLLFSLLVFAVWNKDEVARAITGDKSAHFRTISDPQFAALNSQQQAQAAEQKKEESKEEGAQITIKQTDEGTQMILQLPKATDETKDGSKTAEDAPAIPILHLVPASRSEENSEQQDDSQEEQPRRPMHPYEMEGPSPDAFNYNGMMMHPMMAMQAARAAAYENEMRAWRMRRLQQMLVLAAVQQAQQREAAMRYAFFQRQQWAAQQMAMQQMMEQRRQAEWQEYWRRAAIARMMAQQQAMAAQQQAQVGPSWQPAAEQPRPWWTQQQQPQMAWPQQQFVQQQQQPMMQQQFPQPFWAHLWQQQQAQQQAQQQQQQQQQQQFSQPQLFGQGAQVPQSQPLFLFQQALQARLRERLQQQMQQQEMPQQQSSEESQEQPMPQPQPHAFIFIRRFFPIPQDSHESAPAVSSEESKESNTIPIRPHDASAQQIVEQMRGGQQPEPAHLPDAPIPGIHDRIFQHFQTLSQQIQDHSGQSQQQSEPPLFASIPNSIEQQQSHEADAIYEKLQRKAMQLQADGASTSVQTDSSAASASHSKEDSALVGEDDHDIRRGDAVLGANDKTAQVESDIQTTTEPVMIENFARAQSAEVEDDDDEEEEQKDELTPEEKRRVAQLDSTELKEAAALEASLEREAAEAKAQKDEAARQEMAKVEEEIVHDANKDSSSATSSEEKKDEKEETEPAATTLDPLSEFFRFFENEAVKLSSQDKSAERMVVDSETGSHGTHEPMPLVDEVKDDDNSSEMITKPDEMPAELPSVDTSASAEHVSNEADIKVAQVGSASREIPPITIAAAA